MKILVINGPNINLLGLREPEIYGTKNYKELISLIVSTCKAEQLEVLCFQSNHEGEIIDEIQSAYGVYDGIIINPAGYTHTSVAIADAIRAVGIPTVEVHITDTDAREPYRKTSYTEPACVKTYKGMGLDSYVEAIKYLKQLLTE